MKWELTDLGWTVFHVSVIVLLGTWLSLYFSSWFQGHRKTILFQASTYITCMNIPFYKASYTSKWEHMKSYMTKDMFTPITIERFLSTFLLVYKVPGTLFACSYFWTMFSFVKEIGQCRHKYTKFSRHIKWIWCFHVISCADSEKMAETPCYKYLN